jgi:hypothetical protein
MRSFSMQTIEQPKEKPVGVSLGDRQVKRPNT